jgi:hypothetical protein
MAPQKDGKVASYHPPPSFVLQCNQPVPLGGSIGPRRADASRRLGRSQGNTYLYSQWKNQKDLKIADNSEGSCDAQMGRRIL